MINWDAMKEALVAGFVIVCFTVVMTFALFWGLHLVGADISKKCHCTCNHLMEE